MTQGGHEVTVSRFAMSTGRQVEVLYRRRADSPLEAVIASDGSGQYLLFNENGGAVDGRINRGRFHSMKTGGLQARPSAWGPSLRNRLAAAGLTLDGPLTNRAL